MSRIARGLATAIPLALILASTSWAQLPEKRFITENGQRPTGLFAPGVMVGKTLYIAGKGDNKPHEEFPVKVKNCLGEIEKTLQQAGLGFEHVVKSFVYLEDPDKYDEMNKYYGEFFPQNPPARTTLGVAQVPGDSRLEITCIAYADLADRKPIGQPPANRPYSPGILAGDTLYISGKGDQNPDGTHPATFETQVRQCLKNVEATLKDAGLDFRHVVMSHVFLDNENNREAAAAVYNEVVQDGAAPAISHTVVNWIPGGSHVEITCIATKDLANRRIVRPVNPPKSFKLSAGVWAGNTLYLSSKLGASNGTLAENVEEQTRQLGRNFAATLGEAGLTLEDIVSGHVELTEMKDFNNMNAAYKEYFSKGPGVRTTLMSSTHEVQYPVKVTASFIAAKTRQSP